MMGASGLKDGAEPPHHDNLLSDQISNSSSSSSEFTKDRTSLEKRNAATVTAAEPTEFDPFIPLSDSPDDDDTRSPLTIRAVLLGLLLGSLINAAELYSGLSEGIAVSASLVAPVVGFIVLRLLTRLMPTIRWLGAPLGPRETAIVHATAVGAAGTSGIFTTIVPIMFKTGVLESPGGSFTILLTAAWMCTFGGLFAAAPLRDFIIVKAAKELGLRFPQAEATAVTIHSLHQAGTGVKAGVQRFKAMSIAFVAAFGQKIVAQYAKGVVYNWHFFTWIYEWSHYTNGALVVESWGWFVQLTPQFWGFGMLVGLNMGASMFLGSVIAYGILGPIAVKYGAAAGQKAAPEAGEVWENYLTYVGPGSFGAGGKYIPSVYMLLLWPGIAMLGLNALTELALQLPSILRGMRLASRQIREGVLKRFRDRDSMRYNPSIGNGRIKVRSSSSSEDDGIVDHTNGKEVSFWFWSVGLVLVIIAAVLIAQFQWHVNSGWIVIALLLSCLMAFLNIYGEATTGVSPGISDLFIVLIFSIIVSNDTVSTETSKNALILVAMFVVNGISDMANSLMADYRVGYLLRVPPRSQFMAQFIGTLVSGLSTTAVFVFFVDAYPCLMSPTAVVATCPVAAQATNMYVTLLKVVDAGMFAHLISHTSAILAYVAGGLAILVPVLSRFLLTGEREKYRAFVPNFMAIGLAFVLPYTFLSTSIFFGALVAHIWQKNPSGWGLYGVAVSAGLIAGEGIGGLFGAILDTGGVGSMKYGTGVGCPAGLC